MFIPVGDINRRSKFPFINYALILANIGIYLYMIQQPIKEVLSYALTPNAVELSDFVTSMFLHADIIHLIGNMWFLWIVGDNVEDRYGHWIYIVFYMLAGIVAGIVHVFTITPAGASIPTVGASGAISGMMGAYLFLFPRAKILFWVFPLSFWTGLIKIPSFIAITAWFLLQLYMTFWYKGEADLVAYWAHIGGFVFGAGVTFMLRLFKLVSPGNYLPPSAEAA
jgi:membrane associated rhomboid family serine protease